MDSNEENVPLQSDIEKKLIEDKEILKNQIKQQYKALIKTIDSIGEKDIENKKSTVELDDLTHFDIEKIYCNCCGFTSVEQNIKKTTFYIVTFISNIFLMIEMTICMILLLSENKNNSTDNSSSSYIDNLNVD